MPRGSSSKRQQGAANNRDTRHENGLVGPGKRIVKQKSRNEVRSDGSPKPPQPSSAHNAAPPPSQPPPFPSTAAAAAAAAANANGFARYSTDGVVPELLRRPSVAAYSETSSMESLSTQAVVEDAHRRIDVNAAKNTDVHRDSGPLDFALTVLRSCPLHDTIAILIILMQLSPVALSTIYMLFTLLTFVPPVTTSSGLSLTEIFDGMGAPNLATLIGLDFFFTIFFLFMPLQDLILDFAQVVIAMTLGGGASSRAGTTHNIILCAGIVLLNHFGRHPTLRRYSNFKALLGDSWGSPDADDPLESAAGVSEKRGPKGLLRSILAIHILVQGLVRYVREWYLRREKRDLISQGQSDPEAGKTPTFPGDSSTDGGFTPTDTEMSRQSASLAISTKKRRKQSAQVRIRQPLWAALASTKIVMVKEYELSHAASESAGSNATDIHNLGNAPFNTQPEQIWICYVGCDEVCFNTSPFPDPPPLGTIAENSDGQEAAYIDTSKPFYVRVNNAIWQPTRIMPIDSGEEETGMGTRWTGDIYGLTPMSNYECEFVSTRTGEVIFSTSIRTIQAKTQDMNTSKSPAPRSQYRHESPATTLKTSIAGLETKLSDEKARLKGLRKDNNRKTNAVKKEIDRLTSAVQSTGGNDEKLRQKIAQNNTQQRQADQTIANLDEQLEDFETIPQGILDEHRKRQDEYTSEKARFHGERSSFKCFRDSVDNETKKLQDEHSSFQAKRNKIAARLSKVDNEHARITDANARGLDEVERRRQEREAWEADVARTELEFTKRIAKERAQNTDKSQRMNNMASTIQAYMQDLSHTEAAAASFDEQQYSAAFPAAAQWPQYSSSMWSPASSTAVPASTLASTLMPGQPYSHHVFAQQQQQQPQQQAPLRHKARGRSSSMLSDVSGFTQSTSPDDEDINGTGSNGSSNNSTGNFNAGNTTMAVNANAAPFLQKDSSPGQALWSQSSRGSTALRSPPGIPFPQHSRQRNGSGSGSAFGSGSGGSSVHSGSGSAGVGSHQDSTSPI